jgi:hypothetical protein
MNRNDLRRLARIRLREARALLEAKCFAGAYYLSGYAVECGLKACIAKATKRSEFPDLDRVKASYTHNLVALVKLAGIEPMLQAEAAADRDFRLNWAIAKDWTEQSRYAENTEKQARDLNRAMAARQHGVMRWIRPPW